MFMLCWSMGPGLTGDPRPWTVTPGGGCATETLVWSGDKPPRQSGDSFEMESVVDHKTTVGFEQATLIVKTWPSIYLEENIVNKC